METNMALRIALMREAEAEVLRLLEAVQTMKEGDLKGLTDCG